MVLEKIETSDAPIPKGAYSQGIVAGGFLFTAGVAPHDPTTREIVGDTIAAQTAQTMRNLEAVLGARGLSLSDVVKTTVHLANLERDFASFDETYRSLMKDARPARTTVGSTLAGFLVEIDLIALVK